MKKIFAASAACAALAACASSTPRILSASEVGITYRVSSNNVAKAETAAAEYCKTRGRTAVLDRVTPVGKNSNASFFCR